MAGTSRHRAALLGSPRPGSSFGSALPSGRYPALGRHMETPRVPRSTQKKERLRRPVASVVVVFLGGFLMMMIQQKHINKNNDRNSNEQ